MTMADPDPTPTATPIDVEVKHDGKILVQPRATEPETKVEYTEDSNLADPSRRIWVVTTAALPWRTGTSVNPLVRALYLTRGRERHKVTLMLPWLPNVKSRQKLYGKDTFFESPAEQEQWIRDYCRTRANCAEEEPNLRIMFWEGTYQEAFGSIFPTVDICSQIPNQEADICILEEPEHLNWFRPLSNNKDDRGWADKFTYVVGVLHTNYAAYIRQYGLGTSLVTAPAINALSTLVIRAYCHRVIRLSATLPSLVPSLEVTSNVHGVRDEFLSPPASRTAEPRDKSYAKVYFIGKVIWGKGFDKVLELQELFREATGEYFAMDVYGTGNDEKAIQRAFFGRRAESSMSSSQEDDSNRSSGDEEEHEDKRASEVFKKNDSLRSVLSDEEKAAHAAANENGTATDENGVEHTEGHCNDPLDIIGDLSEKTLSTGVETADAAMQLVESVLTAIFGKERKDSGDEKTDKKATKKSTSNPLRLVPSRARFKWRRTPLKARFLGVKDHADIRDISEHTIFLNMSTTEVLCTTTAEALAMGKFVVIPKHPSNEFFLQFPNCLAYKDLDDAVLKLQYAISNQPEPLMEKYAHILSWQGATERLFEASRMLKTDLEEAEKRGDGLARRKSATFHTESSRNSLYLKKLFGGKLLGKAKADE